MAKIKWVGIIDSNLTEYQKGQLDDKAVKLKMPKSMSQMLLKAIPFAIPSFIVIFLSMFLKTIICGQRVFDPLFIAIGFILGVLLLLVHELLHAVVYPKGATVSIGVDKKTFSPVALASYPIKRNRFILMSLLPFILGVLPLILFICFPSSFLQLNGLMFGLSIMGLISPYPDVYNVFQVLKQTPKNCYLQFYMDDLYYIV